MKKAFYIFVLSFTLIVSGCINSYNHKHEKDKVEFNTSTTETRVKIMVPPIKNSDANENGEFLTEEYILYYPDVKFE
jgi:protein involved in sex pheromone biosynthesis